MRNIQICVGSSCHLRGSYKIIELMKEYIADYGLQDSVRLSGAFCLGKCTDGVSIKIDDEVICGVSSENLRDILDKYIYQKK